MTGKLADPFSGVFDELRARDIPASRIRAVRREEDGGYLYRWGEEEPLLLTEIELYERESLLTEIFLLRPDLSFLIRALPRPVEGLASIRRLSSFRVPLEASARLIGSRIVLTPQNRPHRVLKCFRKSNACLVRTSGDRGEPAYALAAGRSQDEALLTMLALERASLAFLEGSLIGGSRGLWPWTAGRIRRRYLSGVPSELGPGASVYQAVHEALPELEALAFSEGDRLAVFAASHKSFSVSREEDREILGGDPVLVSQSRPRDIVRALRQTSSGCLILAGQGVLVAGRSEEEVQAKLRALERAAGRYISDKVRDLRG